MNATSGCTVKGRSHKRAHQLAARDGKNCSYCGTPLVLECDIRMGNIDGEYAEVDHRVPRAKGGRNDLGNLLLSCQRCNTRKGTKDIEAFRALLQAERAERLRQSAGLS